MKLPDGRVYEISWHADALTHQERYLSGDGTLGTQIDYIYNKKRELRRKTTTTIQPCLVQLLETE